MTNYEYIKSLDAHGMADVMRDMVMQYHDGMAHEIHPFLHVDGEAEADEIMGEILDYLNDNAEEGVN